MEAVLPTLPDDLRPVAIDLWEQARAVTDDVTDTLAMSYRILRNVRGEPASLDVGAEVIGMEVTASLSGAREDVDRACPAAGRAWGGQSGDSFAEYLPQMSTAIQSAHDSAAVTAEALFEYRESIVALWSEVVAKAERTGSEVAAAKSQAAGQQLIAAAAVIDIVEGFADYVEALAESLTQLSGDVHSAGVTLSHAAQTPAGLVDAGEEGLRFPDFAGEIDAVTPAAESSSVDTEEMEYLASAIEAAGTYWDQAAVACSEAADTHLTPDAFGLAGNFFYGEVQEVLNRNRQFYLSADQHMHHLAEALNTVGGGHVEADEDAAQELRRSLEDD